MMIFKERNGITLTELLALNFLQKEKKLLSSPLSLDLDSNAVLAPPSFLPLSSLLSSLPDSAPTYSLLTALRLHLLKPSPLPLLSSLLTSRGSKDSAKLFFWLCHADSPHCPDEHFVRMTVWGFCELERMVEVVRVLRKMARDGAVVVQKIRGLVYRGLLQEVRIDEAGELDLVLRSLEEESDNGDGFGKAAAVLDRLINEWED